MKKKRERKRKYDPITGEKILPYKPKPMVRFATGCYERTSRDGTLTYYVKINGRFIKVGVYESGVVNQAYVKRFRAKLLNQPLDKILPRKSTHVLTVNEGWEKYHGYLVQKNGDNDRNVRPTVSRYNKHIKDYIGTWIMTEVTSDTLRDLRKKWTESGLGDTTQKNLLTLISGIYTSNREYDNPVARMDRRDRIQTTNRRDRFLSIYETERLLNALRWIDETTYVQACFAAYAGLRLREVLNLTSQEIDDPRGILMVRNTKHTHDKGRVRYVQIIPQLHEVIKRYNLQYQGNEKLFPEFNRKAYQKALDTLKLNEGIDPKDQANRVGFHTLRHSFASHMLQSGSNLKEVQEALGHKDISSTMVYAHVSDRQMIEAGQRLADLHKKEDRVKLQAV